MFDPDARVRKVVFVGDAGVGKTCIISSAVRRTFPNDTRPTVGTGFEKLTIGDGPNRTIFEIWDTAGQERYRSLAPNFFKQASAAIFVFDLTNADSIEPLNYFLNGLRQVCPEQGVTISLVGNKTDLDDLRVVTPAEAAELKERLGARFYRECSAKLGLGVLDIFKDLADCPTTCQTLADIDISPASHPSDTCKC
jgi:small GTP-binding protein